MSSSRSMSNSGGGSVKKEWCIAVGSILSVELEAGASALSLKGEVLAHDPSTRFIILKMPSSKCHSQWDIHMVNLTRVKDFQVLSDGTEGNSNSNNNNNNNNNNANPTIKNLNSTNGMTTTTSTSLKEFPPPLPSLNLQKLENRLKDSVEKKKRLIMGYKDGVSVEGQTLFRAISKTLDEVSWEGNNICVMNMVTISPPYKPENVKGSKHMEAFNHVKKIVEKHMNDTAQQISNSSKKDMVQHKKSSSNSMINCNNNTITKESTNGSSSREVKNVVN